MIKTCKNLYGFIGEEKKAYLPHGVTENEFLERLDPKELESIQQNIVYSLIRRKTFENARLFKKWLVIVDATELDEGYQKKNDYYLSRCYNKGENNEFYKYHRSVLEAKIYFGNNLVCSIASETIENSEEYVNQSDETVKQDCESKAFVRLATKIKKKFPRLPIIIGNIEHACSFHECVQKNHYLMEQIVDFMKQLYEYFFLEGISAGCPCG